MYFDQELLAQASDDYMMGRNLATYRYNYSTKTCINGDYNRAVNGTVTAPQCNKLMYQDVSDGSAQKGASAMGGIGVGAVILCCIAIVCVICCKRHKKTTTTKTVETTVTQTQPGMMVQPGMMPMQPGMMQPGMQMQPGMM